jgi:hypothetical protein
MNGNRKLSVVWYGRLDWERGERGGCFCRLWEGVQLKIR